MKLKNQKVLKRIATAFAIVTLAAFIYIQFLAPNTLEARQRLQLESTQTQLIQAQEKVKASQESDQTKAQQIEQLNKQLKDTQDQLQAKKTTNSAVAEAVPAYAVPEDTAKAFIYSHESGNTPTAINASSGACGLGQALPCSKMPCSLSDYACQDTFFTNYMLNRYGSWAAAEAFWQIHHWW